MNCKRCVRQQTTYGDSSKVNCAEAEAEAVMTVLAACPVPPAVRLQQNLPMQGQQVDASSSKARMQQSSHLFFCFAVSDWTQPRLVETGRLLMHFAPLAAAAAADALLLPLH